MPVIDIAYPQLTYGSMDRTEMVIKENSLLNQTTMLSEYWDHYVLLNPHNNLKNQKKLREEKDVDHITVVMLGDSYEEENQLSIDEINSIALLNSSFKNELKRAKNIQNFSSVKFNQYFYYMSKKLSTLPIDNSAVELTSDESIKFTLSFEGDKLLMITKYLPNDDGDNLNGDITYSFFINRKLISSDVTKFETFTKNFKEYLTN